jgi:hypothetical protein
MIGLSRLPSSAYHSALVRTVRANWKPPDVFVWVWATLVKAVCPASRSHRSTGCAATGAATQHGTVARLPMGTGQHRSTAERAPLTGEGQQPGTTRYPIVRPPDIPRTLSRTSIRLRGRCRFRLRPVRLEGESRRTVRRNPRRNER